MSEKNLIHSWKEALSSRPHLRDTFRRMHLSVLHQAVRQELDRGLWYIQFETQDTVLYELKGKANGLNSLTLPGQEDTLWLCIQFQGTLSFPSGNRSEPDTVFSFVLDNNEDLLTVPTEKQWILFLGVRGAARQQLLVEHSPLRNQYDGQGQYMTPAVPMTYVERHALQQFAKAVFGPFSTQHHIGLLLTKLYHSYTQQMVKHAQEQSKDQELVQLYHRAINYITEHYMEEGLNRDKIVEACNSSVRNLTRAFEGRPNTIKSSILIMRLHKGRELLHKHPERTIEDIATTLHFFDAKHFTTHYKKYFHRTPREERKIIK